ncbi:hypothetical protein [Streptomyces sp. CC208A]|uniref:hypothetical protein n=1 Tax=Streptomyces sp. CC208A TaxID=3044573 RepID=UPI0024A927C9|nr:hypothetical protein [Streptomyces sp. CC208A]
MNGSDSDFRLLDVSLHTEDQGRLGVPLGGQGTVEPLVLAEGTVVSLGLTFRLGLDIDGLAFEEERARDGRILATTRTALGSFRCGGPYEVRLPPLRMPVGRAHLGLYRVTGRLTDGRGRELAREAHDVCLVPQGAPPPARPAAAAGP